MDKETVRQAALECRRKCGAGIMDAILAGLGAASFDDLEPQHYQRALKSFKAATPKDEAPAVPKTVADIQARAWANWNKPGKRAPRGDGGDT
jgi:hypothetical protein